MRNLIFPLIFLCIAVHGHAQVDDIAYSLSDSITNRNNELTELILQLQMKEVAANRYKIYPTENVYILLKLDTQTGRIELIQWSFKSNDEHSAILNHNDLSLHKGLNSFELYPTKNIYQFILLDKATGRSWHVQWGTKYSERWIRRIN